ncbi:transposase [Burkholderia cepacia]|uniref:transposase n=1 Tax=Burkholderia cepacia TaxID=292 RepID=UPI0012D97348|nr:transposase [Burkholderia cepacia]
MAYDEAGVVRPGSRRRRYDRPPETDLIVALGEGKQAALVDAGQYPRTAAMHEQRNSEESRHAYRKHKSIVEPPNGWIEAVLGFGQFSMRGLAKVQAEFNFVCMTLNGCDPSMTPLGVSAHIGKTTLSYALKFFPRCCPSEKY